MSQLVCIGRICSSFNQFQDRHYKLTNKLMEQGFRYVHCSRDLQGNITISSLNINAVYVNTLKKECVCQ